MAVGAITTADQVNTLVGVGTRRPVRARAAALADPYFTLQCRRRIPGDGLLIEGLSWPKQYLSGRDQLHALAQRARADAESRQGQVRPPGPDVPRKKRRSARRRGSFGGSVERRRRDLVRAAGRPARSTGACPPSVRRIAFSAATFLGRECRRAWPAPWPSPARERRHQSSPARVSNTSVRRPSVRRRGARQPGRAIRSHQLGEGRLLGEDVAASFRS